MKDDLIFRKKFLSLLSIVAVGLVLLSSFLYKENNSYKNKNKLLILQNDSLISINIKLRATADKGEQPRYTKQNTRTEPQQHE